MRRRLLNLIVPFLFAMLLIFSVQAKEELIVLEAEEDWMSEEPQLNHVTDALGILTESEWEQLENQAQTLEERYEFGVYIVVVEDYFYYSSGSVMDAAKEIYKQYSLGRGSGKDGLLLLLSMNDRDYSLITHGNYGNYTFNDEGRAYLTKYFLDDFADNDWYQGFEDYLSWSEEYLKAAELGNPYDGGNVPMTAKERTGAILGRILIILFLPLVIALIYVSVLTSKMKSVAEATKAASYVDGRLELKEKTDRFINRTHTRTKISSSSGSGSSRSGRSGGSGGFSGTSGKF